MYELYPTDFELIFMKYYKTSEVQFSSDMKDKMLKMMEGRLREFKNSSILAIFQIYMDENRLDNYWLENVFVPLFKTTHRKYSPEEIGQIFRYMMIIGHEVHFLLCLEQLKAV